MTWKPISDAPKDTWVLVKWANGMPYEPQGGPWETEERDTGTPPPPMMVAIYRDNDRNGIWRAYSEDSGTYGDIGKPDLWMELPE